MVSKHKRRTRGGLTYKQWCQKAKDAFEQTHREYSAHCRDRKRKGETAGKEMQTFRPSKRSKNSLAGPVDLRQILDAEFLATSSRSPSKKISSYHKTAARRMKNSSILQETKAAKKTATGHFLSVKRSRQTFGGYRRDANRTSVENTPHVVRLQIPSGQFWTVLEGVAPLGIGEEAGSFLQQILIERRSDLLPHRGRVQELLPVEAKPGLWTAKLQAQRPLGLLRDRAQDWSDKRIIFRHQDHSGIGIHPTNHRAPKGYATTIVDPSIQRRLAMQDQGLRLDCPGFVATLGIFAFDGFSSACECHQNTPGLVRAVLNTCGDHSCWGERNNKKRGRGGSTSTAAVPDLFPVPSFEANGDSSLSWKALTMQVSGGIAILGCFVEDLVKRNPRMDYKVIVSRHEETNFVVGLDVVFTSSEAWDVDGSSLSAPSPDGNSSACPSNFKKLALTRINLSKHRKSIESETLEEKLDVLAEKRSPVISLPSTASVLSLQSHQANGGEMPAFFDSGTGDDIIKTTGMPTTFENDDGDSIAKDKYSDDGNQAIAFGNPPNNKPKRSNTSPSITTKVTFQVDPASSSSVQQNHTRADAGGSASGPALTRTIQQRKNSVVSFITPTPNVAVTATGQKTSFVESARAVQSAANISRRLFSFSNMKSAAAQHPADESLVDAKELPSVQQQHVGLMELFSNRETFSGHLPSMHDVFFGSHDDSEYIEATSAELTAFRPPESSPNSVGLLGAFFAFCNDLFDETSEHEEEDGDSYAVDGFDPSMHDLLFGQEPADSEQSPPSENGGLDVQRILPEGICPSLLAFCEDFFEGDGECAVMETNVSFDSWVRQSLQGWMTLLLLLPLLVWVMTEFMNLEPEPTHPEDLDGWYSKATDWYSWATDRTAANLGFLVTSDRT